MKRLFSSGQSAAVMAIGLVLALCGTTYATGSDAPSLQEASTTEAPATQVGVLGRSFVQMDGFVPGMLPGTAPTYSQVNLMSTGDRTTSGGRITISEQGQLHATATVVLARAPGAGGAGVCDLRINGEEISPPAAATFSDAGLDAAGKPAYPTVVMSLSGAVDHLQPGTYNVGVRCWGDRTDLVYMKRTSLHAVVYGS